MSDNGDVVITVLDESFSLQTTKYTAWDGEGGFRSLLSQLTGAVNDVLSPAVEARVGLRYVNQLARQDVVRPADWVGNIASIFLGPVEDESFQDGVEFFDCRTSLDLGDGKKSLLRYGSLADPARPGKQTFLIDIDCFREGGQAFSADSILSLADELNTAALGIFQSVVDPGLFERTKEVEE